MERQEDLKNNIRESYQLIRDYEDILRLSADPKERAKARRAIEDQRKLIQQWSEEYRQISGSVLLDDLTDPVSSLPDTLTDSDHLAPEKLHVEPQKPVSWLGYFFVSLLGVDLIIALILGWRFFGHQPQLLSYLEVVTGFLSIGLEILLLAIAMQQKMSIPEILRWLGINRLWQSIIALLTIALVSLFFWPVIASLSSESEQAVTHQPITSQTPTPTRWTPCQIESFVAEPSSPQPVGSLVIFKIRGACESGVRAIRVLINDEWYDEKGGHIAPSEEFVPTWLTKDLRPGDYEITAEVVTWRDDEWALAASQTLTYTLIPSSLSDSDSSATSARPWFGPISFCLELDADNRCVAPSSHLPAGTTKFYISWPFRDVPLGTPFRRVWRKDGAPFKTVEDIWDDDWNSPTGVEYTFLDNQTGFPSGQYTLELYLEGDTEPIQQATVRIGP